MKRLLIKFTARDRGREAMLPIPLCAGLRSARLRALAQQSNAAIEVRHLDPTLNSSPPAGRIPGIRMTVCRGRRFGTSIHHTRPISKSHVGCVDIQLSEARTMEGGCR
jgi:hypothetical protein